MMDHTCRPRRLSDSPAFEIFLRTGMVAQSDRGSPNSQIELKSNPWRDPDDGRFTFADQVDPELTVWDIRDMYLRRRFGDKPIIYSDLPDDTVDGYAMTIR